MPIALIGAGAAGCFCAINIKRFHPHAEVHVFERGTKALAKVAVTGRGAYKEEFVTCGGVALSNISPKTLESKSHPGLYFAGEVLDVDGITGGFNLQAAWSMGYVVAENIAESGGE